MNFKLEQLRRRILRKTGYEKSNPEGISRDNFYEMYFALKKPFVVQIGANDGKTHDDLYKYITKYNCGALMVEPQPDIFEQLVENYKDYPNVKCANVAVGEKDETLPFYRVKPELVLEGQEYKASSGSSFYREQIVENVINRIPPRRDYVLKHISDDPNDYIDEVQVPVVTLEKLLKDNSVEEFDFMLTDYQGHDYKVIQQIDFAKNRPDIINFEHSLLEGNELQASRDLLEKEGYHYFTHTADTCAYKI